MRNTTWFFLLCVLAGPTSMSTPACRAAEDRDTKEVVFVLWNADGAKLPIVLPKEPTPTERNAAEELQKFFGVLSGFEWQLVTEDDQTSSGIFIGRTQKAERHAALPADLADEGYVMLSRPEDDSLLLVGADDTATLYAVYDFLHRYGGVRWYLPTDLFQVAPRKRRLHLTSFRLVEQPMFTPRNFGYVNTASYSGEKDPVFGCDRWVLRNRISRGRNLAVGHNLYTIIVASRDGPKHPEYFPMRGGQRFIPRRDNYQDWQPCLTNPDVVRLSVEAARKYFRSNKNPRNGFSLSINDGYGWCECEPCRKANGTPRMFRGREMQSDVYYRYVAQVGEALLDEFPDRKIGVIAYFAAEAPPRGLTLPRNIDVVITQSTAQHHDAKFRDEDERLVKEWVQCTDGAVYRYDYHSMTWVLPRYFPSLVEDDARRMRQAGLRGYYTEEAATWCTMGPLLYVTTRMWWTSEESAADMIEEFCQNLFGKGATEMRQYFGILEEIWLRPRRGRFFEGLRDPLGQVALYTASDSARLSEKLEAAARAVEDERQRERVEFFAQAWRLSEHYLAERDLVDAIPGKQGVELVTAARQTFAAMEEHRKFYEQFRETDPLLSGNHRWIIETLGRDRLWRYSVEADATAALVQGLAEIGANDAERARTVAAAWRDDPPGERTRAAIDLVEKWLKTPPPPNGLRNPEFHPDASTSTSGNWIDGAPPEWRWDSGDAVYIRHRDGVVQIEAGHAVGFGQGFAVKPGELILASVRYHTGERFGGIVNLRCRFQDATGSRRLREKDLINQGSGSLSERRLQVFGVVPEGAVSLRLSLGTRRLTAGEQVNFRAPYLGRKH